MRVRLVRHGQNALSGGSRPHTYGVDPCTDRGFDGKQEIDPMAECEGSMRKCECKTDKEMKCSYCCNLEG
jgi:hypothetical protein